MVRSTLADRLLEQCEAVSQREMEEQLLDNMDLERERGITIKARAVRMEYKADDGENYHINLIDTPGHVDFNYEVSRSLAACEGALLVVDAAQGIEAQTLGNTYLAIDAGLEVLPVITRSTCPLPMRRASSRRSRTSLACLPWMRPKFRLKWASTSTPYSRILSPMSPRRQAMRMRRSKRSFLTASTTLIKVSSFYMRLMDGHIEPGMKVKMMATGAEFQVIECGYLEPLGLSPQKGLYAGEVGYFYGFHLKM